MENKNEKYSGFTKVKMAAIFLCLLVCVAYLGIINTTAVKGYEVRNVEERIEALRKENKQLQIEEAELNSFYNIKDNIGNLNMVETEDVVYIDDNDDAMAIKK